MGSLWRRLNKTPEDQFADEMAALIKSLLGVKATRGDGFALRLDHSDGTMAVLNLDAIYAEARVLTGEARTGRLRTAVLAMRPEPRPESWEAARPRLMPAVRSATWLSAVGLDGVIHRQLVPFLTEVCAIDSEHGMTFATARDIANWRVTIDDVMKAASGNLGEKPAEVGRAGPIAFLAEPDGYVSSWVAVPDRLAGFAENVGEHVIAMIPSRDQLIMVDTSQADVTAKVVRVALSDYEQSPRQISPVPYVVAPQGIAPWVPPRDHPAALSVQRSTRVLANNEYLYQRGSLDAAAQAAGEDVFVAGYTLVERQDGSMFSWAPWVKQVSNGLVPEVDVVLFGNSDDKAAQFAVRWEDAIAIAPLVREPSFDPPRWRYRGWPDPETLAALRAAAVPFPPPLEVTDPA